MDSTKFDPGRADESRAGALPQPDAANGFLLAHARLLRDSLRRWTGRDLIEPGVAEGDIGRWLYHAPFALLSHDAAPEPMFTYANLTALGLFELSWEQLLVLPSRVSAEPVNREERARLLHEVAARGVIDNYSGVRISRTGRRFLIEQATVWNLLDQAGRYCGQAAMFRSWVPLD